MYGMVFVFFFCHQLIQTLFPFHWTELYHYIYLNKSYIWMYFQCNRNDKYTVCITYHDLTKRTHFHYVLELFIHISQSKLTWRKPRRVKKDILTKIHTSTINLEELFISSPWCRKQKCNILKLSSQNKNVPCLSFFIRSSLSSSFNSFTLSISPSMSPIPKSNSIKQALLTVEIKKKQQIF